MIWLAVFRKLYNHRYQPRTITCRNFPNYYPTSLNDLQSNNFEPVFNSSSVNEAWSFLKSILKNALMTTRLSLETASHLDLSLSMKMCAQRKAGRRQRARRASPAVCTLPMVPCGSSPVTRVSRSPLPCEKRSAWGGGCFFAAVARLRREKAQFRALWRT